MISPIEALQDNSKFRNTESKLVEGTFGKERRVFSNHFSKSYNYNISSQKLASSTVIGEELQDISEQQDLSEVTEVRQEIGPEFNQDIDTPNQDRQPYFTQNNNFPNRPTGFYQALYQPLMTEIDESASILPSRSQRTND